MSDENFISRWARKKSQAAGERRQAGGGRQEAGEETRDEKRETRDEKRETRDEKRETRDEKRETRDGKRETRGERRDDSAPGSPATLPVPAEPQPLPPVESLTPESDFSPFMRDGVDPGVRRVAVKKLFEDPRFNVMDGLDVYIDDYSKPDPLPEGWLEKLNQTARLGIFQPAPAEPEEPAPPEAACESPSSPAEKEGDAPPPPAVTSAEALDVSQVGQSAPDKV